MGVKCRTHALTNNKNARLIPTSKRFRKETEKYLAIELIRSFPKN